MKSEPSLALLMITELYLPTKGGTAVWFDQVYRRLGTRNVHIVTADVPGASEHDRAHPNTVHRLHLARNRWLRPESLAMYLKLLGRSLWTVLRHGIREVHAGRALPEGLVAWLCGRAVGGRTVCYAHGEELTGWGRGWKYRAMCFVLRHVDLVIANSDFTRTTLLAMGVDPARIEIVNPGVDIERFRPGLPFADLRATVLGSAGGGGRLLLSVGRLQRRKGFDTVIRVLPTLIAAGHDLHYAIIGIGEDHDYLRGLAAEAGVDTRVHLLGHVSMDDLPRWYNACDLFLLVNRDIDGDTEGFGMVFLEANACGKAVVAGIAGGTGSAVVDGETGLRVDGTDVPAVTAAIGRLLQDQSLRERLGKRGHERVAEAFSWSAVARRTRRLMRPGGEG